MTMKDPANNSYTGYDIDVMTELAKDLNVELEFVPADWKTLVSGVTSGKYQMTGPASVSSARAKAAGYSNSYFSLATVPLILAKNSAKFKDWGDLDKAGVTVAATLGTTQEKQVEAYFPMPNTRLWRHRHVTFRKYSRAGPMHRSHQTSRPTSSSSSIHK